MNDYIDADDFRVHYMSVDDVVDQIWIYSPHCQLAKLDLEDAFKHIPLRPQDWELLGYTWYIYDPVIDAIKPQYYFDKMIQFRARSSPHLFNNFAKAAKFVMERHGVSYVDHYLDDYVTAGPKDTDICDANLNTMLSICQDLGFAVNPKKVVLPTTELEFLGITLDTVKMELRISEERIEEVTIELLPWKTRKSCTKRELLSLIGKLIFISRVVQPGRTFVRRMIDLSKRIKHLHYKSN